MRQVARLPGRIVYPGEKSIFKGDNFSFGDSYIAEKAKYINTKNTGNPRSWLEAGINHHLTLTARQVASLRVA